ncbi:DUF4416 family protein [bacterium]|nr:DUF4416 family protein [candidate division CSSED10-310 bacterium]
MKSIRINHPSVLFFAILATDMDPYQSARAELTEKFGTIIHEISPSPFTLTRYYDLEMGERLLKGFIGFAQPVSQADLVRCKRTARDIEWRHAIATDGKIRRKLNLDPGLVTLASVILSTSKNFAHRIYIGDGVFAEVTLIYHPSGWRELPWTYPDYKTPGVMDFLIRCRSNLKKNIDRTPS